MALTTTEKRRLKGMGVQLRQIKKRLGVERDKLRALLGEYQDILDKVETAHEDLERIADDLSCYF